MIKAIWTKVGKYTKSWNKSWMVTCLENQMDQKARCQNMNSNLAKNQDVDPKIYGMSNKGTILEPKSLWTKEWFARHQMFSIEVGVKREMYIRGLQKHPSYKRWSPMRGIRPKVYPRKGVIHVFQTPWIVQEIQGTNCYWRTLEILQVKNLCVGRMITISE